MTPDFRGDLARGGGSIIEPVNASPIANASTSSGPADDTAVSGNAWPPGLEALAEPLLRQHAQLGAHPLALKDASTGVYLHVNPPMAALFGRRVAEVVGRTDSQLLSAPRAAALRAADQTALAQHPQPSQTRHRFEWRGERRHFDALRVVVSPAGGGEPRIVASLWTDRSAADEQERTLALLRSQIEQEQRLVDRLRNDSSLPASTHRPFDATFATLLRREFDLSARERREFVLMFVELDDPPLGEPPPTAEQTEALQAAVERLVLANTRAMDSACRCGPRCTAVLWSGVGLAVAYGRAEALRQQCARYAVSEQGQSLGLSVSIGLAGYPHTTADRPALVERAEQALMRARARGPGQVALAAVPFPRPAGLHFSGSGFARASSPPAPPAAG